MDDRSVVSRVVEILAAASSRAVASLADLTLLTGLPKPTVRRIAEQLVESGALTRTPWGYQVGTRLQRLGRPHASPEALAPVHDALTALHAQLGGIAWFTAHADRVDEQPELVVTDPAMRLQALREWPAPTSLSTIALTAIGQCVLSRRPELAERVARTRAGRGLRARLHASADRGAFVDDEAHTPGRRCVAVPLVHGGVLGVTVPADRSPLDALVRATLAAAARVDAAGPRDGVPLSDPHP
ncbi:helix-turn-helix domain-containing protein [Xylanimonas protaetiae]|uniref:helix-turn-helix domain-containing protein n=1 Tax=Xylanimonas protaetiae TaxID=2509457 RepID=UPI0013ECE9F9|nr:helix-turn-helix domain-containing protein [Xylanimonas protaetiae]